MRKNITMKPNHSGTSDSKDGESVYNWMAFNRRLSKNEVETACLEHGFQRWYGGAGQGCSDIVWWRSKSRTLIIERCYLDI